jgi:hypothetical protein
MAALICENAILARHLAAAQARCQQLPDTAGAAASVATPGPAATAAGPPRRRKLHELPAHAQDLLLALSFKPATLRSEIEKALARLRGQPVQLLGSEADLLYSALHDMGKRNGLTEALQRRLEARHSVAVRRLAPLRDAEILRQIWLATVHEAARPHEDIPAMLWALLTHPLGAAQEVRALAEARTWVFGQARKGQVAADLAAAQRVSDLQAELARLQERLQQQQAEHSRALAQVRQQAATWVGEARRCQPATTPTAPAWVSMHAPRPRAEARSAVAAASGNAEPPASKASGPEPQAAARTTAAPSPVQGRRVLCVGGIQHAVSRYRSRIETLGGRFEHHDGGIHDNAHGLEGRLARADLVICQAGCINHAAYHRIKQHCQRTGTPCLYLERASLSRFDRALQGLQTTVSGPGKNPAP